MGPKSPWNLTVNQFSIKYQWAVLNVSENSITNQNLSLFEFKQGKTLIFKPDVMSKKHWLTSSIKNQHLTTIQKNRKFHIPRICFSCFKTCLKNPDWWFFVQIHKFSRWNKNPQLFLIQRHIVSHTMSLHFLFFNKLTLFHEFHQNYHIFTLELWETWNWFHILVFPENAARCAWEGENNTASVEPLEADNTRPRSYFAMRSFGLEEWRLHSSSKLKIRVITIVSFSQCPSLVINN